MRRPVTLLLAVTCVAVWSLPALAQQPAPAAGHVLVGSDSLVGTTVRTPDGRDVGKVSRLMIDPSDGRVVTVVLTTGSRLGMGGNTLSVPWNTVKVGQEQGRVIVTLTQMLESAPKSEKERARDSAPAASPQTAPPPPASQNQNQR
jgi:sporulation protein YlmC with PRC-barrel domain